MCLKEWLDTIIILNFENLDIILRSQIKDSTILEQIYIIAGGDGDIMAKLLDVVIEYVSSLNIYALIFVLNLKIFTNYKMICKNSNNPQNNGEIWS